MKDWKIFFGDGGRHDGLTELPKPPPWRFAAPPGDPVRPPGLDLDREHARAAPFRPTPEMVIAVNAALYLRRPLLITGKPGTGKSTLIAKVADELGLGPVIRWPIASRSTVRGGVYEYDAVGRLQAGTGAAPAVESYLRLGPLGTALTATTWPRPLLIDEIDKSDLDFANDLLNVIEEGEYEIPELQRLAPSQTRATVRDCFGEPVTVTDGTLHCGQFPFVVMTSNAEREFPPPFLRRCVRLRIEPPGRDALFAILQAHLARYPATLDPAAYTPLVDDFLQRREANDEVATDQLLNAVFLTVALPGAGERTFSEAEFEALRANLLHALSGPAA
jgi:MoxR-like ATPase